MKQHGNWVSHSREQELNNIARRKKVHRPEPAQSRRSTPFGDGTRSLFQFRPSRRNSSTFTRRTTANAPVDIPHGSSDHTGPGCMSDTRNTVSEPVLLNKLSTVDEEKAM